MKSILRFYTVFQNIIPEFYESFLILILSKRNISDGGVAKPLIKMFNLKTDSYTPNYSVLSPKPFWNYVSLTFNIRTQRFCSNYVYK